VPPTAPPTAPGAPAGWGPPPGSPPPYGAAPYASPYGTPAEEPAPAKKSKAGLIVALLVVALLVVGGIVAALVVMSGSSGELELTVDTCEIAADGSLSATGTVSSSSATDVEIDLEFTDSATGQVVDDDSVDIAVPEGAAQRWSASGSAGDQVQRVTCTADAES
jgi:hypothetical protein